MLLRTAVQSPLLFKFQRPETIRPKRKPKMKRPFNLPPAPVDGHRIQLWKFDSFNCKITKLVAVYHFRAEFSTHLDSESTLKGIAFEDEWAVYFDGVIGTRRHPWDWKSNGQEMTFAEYFATEEEARADGRERLRLRIERARADIKHLKVALDALGPELPTPLDVAIRELFSNISKNYEGFDIVTGWNLKPGSPEGNTARTALDIVVQELLERAITG